MGNSFKYIYGPVHSWRLGMSLGLDPLAAREKVCNFDCVYCQLGKTKSLTQDRQVFVRTEDLIAEVSSLPKELHVDYLTFSGRGEPTLAVNLGAMIHCLRQVRSEPIAVITNSSLMSLPDVRQDLSLANFVMAKLDACSQESFACIDRAGVFNFREIIDGIRRFRDMFKGRLALQIMFIEDNLSLAGRLADIARLIGPDEVQLNTPLRPCAVGFLPPERMEEIKMYFKSIKVVTVYDAPSTEYSPLDEATTVSRHGNYRKQRLAPGETLHVGL
ncbi:MAG: 4Fe-4S cluster-binding domain-containing protein [Candidatus Omnitrophica bacterium]|nr:4Fe-4S cluster-binding domain-containing protein [Candidatus Omnitrophota bacterium]